jgi:hypothetical protein
MFPENPIPKNPNLHNRHYHKGDDKEKKIKKRKVCYEMNSVMQIGDKDKRKKTN